MLPGIVCSNVSKEVRFSLSDMKKAFQSLPFFKPVMVKENNKYDRKKRNGCYQRPSERDGSIQEPVKDHFGDYTEA